MAVAPTQRASNVFVILNPAAGGCTPADVRAALCRHFPAGEGACEVHETARDDDPEALARAAAGRGCDLVVAVGGDGTVSAVASGLVGSGTALGIVPMGTANVLARALGLPLDLEGACALLAGPHRNDPIDAMRVGDRHYFLQIGVGLDAVMIRDTPRRHKRRFGRLAYLWTLARGLAGFSPRRFVVVVDGSTTRKRAVEVLLANAGTLGQEPFRWGPGIKLDDGHVDVCIVRARNGLDYLRLTWAVLRGHPRRARNVRYLAARRKVVVESRPPLPIQADGEVLGETPLEVVVVPGAVRVVVPEAEASG